MPQSSCIELIGVPQSKIAASADGCEMRPMNMMWGLMHTRTPESECLIHFYLPPVSWPGMNASHYQEGNAYGNITDDQLCVVFNPTVTKLISSRQSPFQSWHGNMKSKKSENVGVELSFLFFECQSRAVTHTEQGYNEKWYKHVRTATPQTHIPSSSNQQLKGREIKMENLKRKARLEKYRYSSKPRPAPFLL